jgi:hypothetical protein
VKLAVVAEYDPALSRDRSNPDIVRRGIREPKFALWIVVVFNRKRTRLRAPDDFRKTFPKTPIKIECQWASD